MKLRSMLFSTLLFIWFLLFQQMIEGKSIDTYESYMDEDMITTENTDVDFENTTDIYENNYINLVTEEETRIHPEDTFNTTSDDIIYLNVGGHKITTYRSTLTAVPHSKLALIFAKNNQNKTKTKNDRVYYFFDYNAIQFEHLIDQLRVIKRMPSRPAYEITFKTPNVDSHFAFSDMLVELGLNAERFLSPLVGTHIDLSVDSLIGWKQCFRGAYNVPFDIDVLINRCKGKRLLVACRSIADRKTLTVAGVGKRENLFRTCSPNSYCSTEMSNNTGFYYVDNQAWGFEGRPKSFIPNINQYHHQYYNQGGQGSFLLNPCDSSDEYSPYRLCWSLRSSVGRGGGDRCGILKNLHNTKGWERVIYETV